MLANATELFTNLDQSMPKFEEWVHESMGINATATLEEFEEIWLPMPSNSSTGYDASVTCVKHYGYTYYLQAQFVILCAIILFQVGRAWKGRSWRRLLSWHPSASDLAASDPPCCTHPPQVGGSLLFIIRHYWRKFTGAAFGTGSMVREGIDHPAGKVHSDTTSEFEIAIQPGSARFAANQVRGGRGALGAAEAGSRSAPGRTGSSPRTRSQQLTGRPLPAPPCDAPPRSPTSSLSLGPRTGATRPTRAPRAPRPSAAATAARTAAPPATSTERHAAAGGGGAQRQRRAGSGFAWHLNLRLEETCF